MKKKVFIILIAQILGCAFVKADVAINAKNFPDSDFRTWVQKHFNKPNGAVLTDEELASVKEISWNPAKGGFTSVENLKGIEFFSELETIEIWNQRYRTHNNVSSVDLSKNKKLKKFAFSKSDYEPNFSSGKFPKKMPPEEKSTSTSDDTKYLRGVNLKDLPNLETVIIDYHELTELDLRGCPHLRTIKITHSHTRFSLLITDLCEELETLDISRNYFTELYLGLMPNLKSLNFSYNVITDVDLSPLKELETLCCRSNYYTSLDISNNKKLKSLDCNDSKITALDCSQNDSLSSINIESCKQLEVFPTLPSGIESINCDNVKAFAKVDLSAYPNLKELSAKVCELRNFDATKMPKLESLDLRWNSIAALDLSCLKNLDFENTFLDQIFETSVIRNGSGMRVPMPKSFDLSKVYSYDFINESDQQNGVLYSEYFTDSDGAQQPSFVVNFLRTGSTVFNYQYRTGFYYTENGKQVEMLMSVNVYPTSYSSGVEELNTVKDVKNVLYFDLQGHESSSPFNGFNIEVTQFSDGSSLSRKLVK